MKNVTFAVCDDGRQPANVDSPDKDGFTVTDNGGDDTNPTDEPDDDNVDVFGDTPVTIPSNPPDQPQYTVKVTTPKNTDDTPMSISTTTLTNVKEVQVSVNGGPPQTVVSLSISITEQSVAFSK